jgi:hypothetical protein
MKHSSEYACGYSDLRGLLLFHDGKVSANGILDVFYGFVFGRPLRPATRQARYGETAKPSSDSCRAIR